MPLGADRLIFWPAGIETLAALKYRDVLPREGRLVPATTVRVIAGAAGGVCAAAVTVRPTPKRTIAMAKRMVSDDDRSG